MKEVPADQIVKGFEYEKGRYIILNDEDFEKVRIESTHSIDITDFLLPGMEHEIVVCAEDDPHDLAKLHEAFVVYLGNLRHERQHLTDAHAEGAQWLLTGHNVFQTTWYDGQIDGIVGPKTAAAFHQAKYDIGYADDKLEPTFGPALRDYLTGALLQTPAQKQRAAQRHRPFVWPTSPRGIVIGWPGQGTHSFRLPPNNWQSDNAWDIAVPIGLESTVRAVRPSTSSAMETAADETARMIESTRIIMSPVSFIILMSSPSVL